MDQGQKHVLCVSYDRALLRTREMLLRRRGYKVTAAHGLADCVKACKTARFDLFILGHSIPRPDKTELIRAFRKYCPAPVLSLLRHGETVEDNADSYTPADDPERLLDAIDEILRTFHADGASGLRD